MMQLTPLYAEQIPLEGRHLIEASAGTGKTFNITRIYLRLLLEREVSVEQILVMTFTKDATEEIRSRIGMQLRNTLANWDELVATDNFFKVIANKVTKEKALLLIRKALLFLDDAAIFTIHGFCKRILSQYAFDSGLLFNMQMESDCKEQTIEAVQDWYRTLSKTAPNDYLAIAEFWPEPASFYQVFGSAIGKQAPLTFLSEEDILNQFLCEVNDALASLTHHQSFLFEQLVDNQKGAKRDERIGEYQQLLDWLNQAKQSKVDDIHQLSALPNAFADGRRYGRSKVKAQLVDIFAPLNALIKTTNDIGTRINKSVAYQIAANGIKAITSQVLYKKQQLALLSFDDLIEVLATKLSSQTGNHSGQTLATQIYQQFPVAMIDEFQDTDPHQFSILKHIYQSQTQAALYLIGDPKQAIYGFRGGDIFTYLSARHFCQQHWVMDTNWRSTANMITGYNRLFYGNELSQPAQDTFGFNIPYHPVKASNSVACSGFNDDEKALQFIHFNPEQDKPTKLKPAFRKEMATWLANKIITLLAENSASLTAADIAILVRDGTEATIIKQALSECGLVSVYLSNRSNLWHTEQAQQLLLILRGVLYYENDRFFNAALASGLMGYSQSSLLALQNDELAWQDVKFAFKALRDDWEHKGFISAALSLLHHHVVVEQDDKERVLTNLLHMFELLQSASARHHQPQELLFWFEQQLTQDGDAETELRLESDEQLIKIVTQHGSKGLEYPVVFVPFATRHKAPGKIGNRNITVVNYHTDDGNLHTVLEGQPEQRQAMYKESYAESVRLLYVAVTRAVQRCYMMVADFEECHLSPLGQTLGLSSDSDLAQAVWALHRDYPDSIGIETIAESVAAEHVERGQNVEQNLSNSAAVSVFQASIERDWWLSSFTALSRNLRHGGVSLPDRDAAGEIVVFDNEETQSGAIQFDITKGAHTGNLLHDILEHVNFDKPDWQEVIRWQQAKYAKLLAMWQSTELENWMSTVFNTPLAAGMSLANIGQNRTLKEQEFYFPMQKASSHRLAQLLTEHRKRISKPNNQELVKLPAYQQLKGMMHGFIDLIFEHQGKFYVCDYKSTHLGNSFGHYHKTMLHQDIAKNYYDLQYLIYSLALHRMLKLRINNYDPQVHFGGVYYLYLRGMSTANYQGNNESCGVFYTDICVKELDALDELFKGTLN